MSTEDAVGPIRFSVNVILRIVENWGYFLADGALGYIMLICMAFIYYVATGGELVLAFLQEAVSVGPIVTFYVFMAALVFAAFHSLVLQPDEWFDTLDRVQRGDGLRQYVLTSFAAATNGLYRAGIVLSAAWAAARVHTAGFEWAAGLVLIAVPVIDLWLLREFNISIIGTISRGVALLLATVIILTAILHYSYHRYPHITENVKAIALELIEIVIEGTGPNRGFFLRRWLASHRRPGHGLK